MKPAFDTSATHNEKEALAMHLGCNSDDIEHLGVRDVVHDFLYNGKVVHVVHSSYSYMLKGGKTVSFNNSVWLIAKSEFQPLDIYLQVLRNSKKPFLECLEMAKSFVLANDGAVVSQGDNVTVLRLHLDEGHCFKPYPDIDLFYFET